MSLASPNSSANHFHVLWTGIEPACKCLEGTRVIHYATRAYCNHHSHLRDYTVANITLGQEILTGLFVRDH